VKGKGGEVTVRESPDPKGGRKKRFVRFPSSVNRRGGEEKGEEKRKGKKRPPASTIKEGKRGKKGTNHALLFWLAGS